MAPYGQAISHQPFISLMMVTEAEYKLYTANEMHASAQERLVLEYDQAKRLVALSSARGVDTLDKDTGKAMSTRLAHGPNMKAGGPCQNPQCRVTTSPQWRHPKGTTKEFCNACGIHWARYQKLRPADKKKKLQGAMAVENAPAAEDMDMALPPIEAPLMPVPMLKRGRKHTALVHVEVEMAGEDETEAEVQAAQPAAKKAKSGRRAKLKVAKAAERGTVCMKAQEMLLLGEETLCTPEGVTYIGNMPMASLLKPMAVAQPGDSGYDHPHLPFNNGSHSYGSPGGSPPSVPSSPVLMAAPPPPTTCLPVLDLHQVPAASAGHLVQLLLHLQQHMNAFPGAAAAPGCAIPPLTLQELMHLTQYATTQAAAEPQIVLSAPASSNLLIAHSPAPVSAPIPAAADLRGSLRAPGVPVPWQHAAAASGTVTLLPQRSSKGPSRRAEHSSS